MKKLDMSNIPESSEYKKPTAGAYICTITDVEDVPEKEYLRISYDIAEGEFAGYYGEMRENNPDWSNVAVCYRSYKQTALGLMKRFCSAVSKSNGAFIFDAGAVNADEKTLIGKKIGMILREEEYYGNDGNKKRRLYVDREFAVGDIDKQRVPEPKLLKDEPAATTDAEEVPFK